MNLHSSTNSLGKYVSQIIHFSSGQKKTFEHIDTESIKDGTFTKMRLQDGRMLMVNGNNVDCIEVIAEPEPFNFKDMMHDLNKN